MCNCTYHLAEAEQRFASEQEMHTLHKPEASTTILGSYHQPVQKYNSFHYPLSDNNMSPEYFGSQSTNLSFQTCNDQYFTLDSSTLSTSCLSDPHQSSDYTQGSPFSICSGHKLTEQVVLSRSENTCHGCSKVSNGRWNWSKHVVPSLDHKQLLISCARAISDGEMDTAVNLMDMLEQIVSVSGTPIQRLGAYLLEGLRARVESSGSLIYQKLRCDEPTLSELMSSMHVLYEICPYWKFAYESANAVIMEVMENEPRIHIIDFQIAQGSQWIPLIGALACRPGGSPTIRITGVDDPESVQARGGGLEIVGQRLLKVAEAWNVPFEFCDATMFGYQVKAEDLRVQVGEALAVNFPYVLHHVPDESVSTENHRDRLLRLVRGLCPKVVTLVEQESNTNTSPFYSRFLETLDYYTAMFESIDVTRPRNDKQRISAEQHCIARDIVNMVACEGAERVERHELLGKWRSRLSMAGFRQYSLSPSVICEVQNMLKEYSRNYRVEERNGALYLGWMNRAMSTSSAWR